MKYRPTSL